MEGSPLFLIRTPIKNSLSRWPYIQPWKQGN